MEKVKILVVDDQPANIIAMRRTIDELALDVEVFTASSGNQALSLQLDHRFALVILDVQMPEMDGFEVAELMRGHPASSQIPLIFVTANAIDSYQMFKGYKAGAVDFLHKPYDPHVLGSKIKIFVELDQRRRLQEAYLHQIEKQKEHLSRLNSAAEAANRSKTRFLANMSHEIRTPLSAILGFADLLSIAGSTEEEKQGYVAKISSNGQLLLEIINDVLDFSKIEAGRVEVEKLEVPLLDLVREVEGIFTLKAKEKRLDFRIDLDKGLPDRVTTDPTRLKQILTNVVGNAIKFTSRGEVIVQVSTDKGCDGLLKMTVRDTGIGLAAKDISKLFTPFSQSDSSTTRKFGGTGLGLAISRELAQALGGDLHLTQTQPGKGSLFTIKVNSHPHVFNKPGERTAALPSSAVSIETGNSQQLKGLKILLVEDSADNRFLIKHMLVKSGAHVETAKDGKAGMERATSGSFDAVLMDVQMPEMDGLEATALLRRADYHRPIIALTAHAFKEERDRCLEAGFTDHVAKPIDFNILIEKIVFHCLTSSRDSGSQHPREQTAEKSARKAGSSMKKRELSEMTKKMMVDSDLAPILISYANRLPEAVENLRVSLGMGNMKHALLQAHDIRGTAGNMGFDNIARLCQLLENRELEETDKNAMDEDIEALVYEAEFLRQSFGNDGPTDHL